MFCKRGGTEITHDSQKFSHRRGTILIRTGNFTERQMNNKENRKFGKEHTVKSVGLGSK